MDDLKSMADLLDLQAVDAAVDKLLDDRAKLPALAEYQSAHAASTVAKTTYEAVAAQLRELDLAVDKTEGELELAEQKLELQEQRLFAGGMSAKETDNMRLEVESLRRQKSTMEDELLDLLDQREGVEKTTKEAEVIVASTGAEETRLEGAIAGAWKSIDDAIARKEVKKAEIVPLVEEDLMELYNELRATRGGVVVGALEGRTCGSCFIELSAAEHHEVLQDDPPRCIHCGAILVP